MACESPTYIKLEKPKFVEGQWQYAFPADCGKCIVCLKKRKNQWSYRLMEEKQYAFSSYFVTLTYTNEFVPYGDDGYCANANDHKEFIKWLRYYETSQKLSERLEISSEEYRRQLYHIHEAEKLKYMGVIEYGDLGDRPHWHYILFNVVDIDNIDRAWSTQICTKERSYHPPSAAEYKPGVSKGRIDIDECNVNTVDYVLKYMMKHEMEKQNNDRQEERAFMSKGIGLRVATDEFIRHIAKPYNNQVLSSRGFKVPLPRIFRKKFLSEAENAAKQEYTIKEALRAKKEREDEIVKMGMDVEEVRRSTINARNNALKNRRRRSIE